MGTLIFVALVFSVTVYRFQVSLFEFMCLLTVLGISNGIIVRNTLENGEVRDFWAGLQLLQICLLVMLPFCFGSAWGLHSAQRMGELRTWRRLALIVAGWGLSWGAFALLVATVRTMDWKTQLTGDEDAYRAQALQAWAVASLALPGIGIEWWIRKKFRQSPTEKDNKIH